MRVKKQAIPLYSYLENKRKGGWGREMKDLEAQTKKLGRNDETLAESHDLFGYHVLMLSSKKVGANNLSYVTKEERDKIFRTLVKPGLLKTPLHVDDECTTCVLKECIW